MKIKTRARLARAGHWTAKRFASKAYILMYHRITEPESDPWGLCVSPHHFTEHLEILKKYGHPMRLLDLAQRLQDGKIPARAVVVTFDDGYADNLYQAKPLLESYNIPATVFMPTGQIRDKGEFWWDELDRLLLHPPKLPERLCLEVKGGRHVWELSESGNHQKNGRRHYCDQSEKGVEPCSRRSLYFSVYQLLLPLSEEDRQAGLQEIRKWTGAEPEARPAYKTLSPEEVNLLGQGGLIEIGAHTITHPFLSAHPEVFQQREIERGKIDLEELTGRPVNSFAYPHGDYNKKSVALVQKAGFVCACSIEEYSVWRHSDPFLLPRLKVENYNGKEFTRRLLRILALK